MAVARYWKYSAVSRAGNYVVLNGIELRTTADGVLLTTAHGGTASASGFQYGKTPDQAFDARASNTYWNSDINATPWAKWDFGVGNAQDVKYLTLELHNMGGLSPSSGVLAYSDDDVSWTDLIGTPGIVDAASALYNYYAPEHADFALALPALSFSIVGGSTVGLVSVIPTLTARGGVNANVVMPKFVTRGVAHDATGENYAALTLPAFGVKARGGANARLIMPRLVLQLGATFTAAVTAALTLPRLTASGTGRVSGSISSSVNLSVFTMVGYGGAVISATIGGFTIAAEGTVGGVVGVRATLPLFKLAAEVTAESHASAALVLPALQAVPGATAYLILPGFTLAAIGTATVAVTYEAYALNLKHTSADATDELTRFTNYPFDKIIRYKNSYFGVNSTGLYLLEGTTDDAAPISYSVKTKLTDFGTDQMKTPEAAVFGGRLGPDATVTVYTGETEDDVYAYTTPRGQGAQNYRQKFGKGLKARYYAFGIQGDGAMAIDTVSFDLATLKRRI